MMSPVNQSVYCVSTLHNYFQESLSLGLKHEQNQFQAFGQSRNPQQEGDKSFCYISFRRLFFKNNFQNYYGSSSVAQMGFHHQNLNTMIQLSPLELRQDCHGSVHSKYKVSAPGLWFCDRTLAYCAQGPGSDLQHCKKKKNTKPNCEMGNSH